MLIPAITTIGLAEARVSALWLEMIAAIDALSHRLHCLRQSLAAADVLICLGDRPARSLVHSVPRLRMLDEHHFRPLGKPVVRNLDRIAAVDNVGN
jgi:hypothetical protein